MNNDMFLDRTQLGYVRRQFQLYAQGKPCEDEQLITYLLKCSTVVEKGFLRQIYLPSSGSLDEWVGKCAEEAGIPRGYGWLILRMAEARFAKAKGWK